MAELGAQTLQSAAKGSTKVWAYRPEEQILETARVLTPDNIPHSCSLPIPNR